MLGDHVGIPTAVRFCPSHLFTFLDVVEIQFNLWLNAPMILPCTLRSTVPECLRHTQQNKARKMIVIMLWKPRSALEREAVG